jgi:hypothetical protein
LVFKQLFTFLKVCCSINTTFFFSSPPPPPSRTAS